MQSKVINDMYVSKIFLSKYVIIINIINDLAISSSARVAKN